LKVEQEANENYLKLAELLPESKDQLLILAKMESRHKKGLLKPVDLS
jgi:hypothetical protein